MIASRHANALARWLAINQPEVFEGLLRAAQGKTIPRTVSNLAGIMDVLGNFGTTFSGAVKSVGSFLTSDAGLATVGTIGGLYLQSQAQKDALKLQVATIKAGYPPQDIVNAGPNTNSAVPIYAGTGQALTPQLAARLTPRSILADYAPWGLALAAGLAFLFVMRPRN